MGGGGRGKGDEKQTKKVQSQLGNFGNQAGTLMEKQKNNNMVSFRFLNHKNEF